MRRRDIMSTYCTVSRSDKFEFLYEYYYNYKNILSCERSCVIYMIESFMMKYHWDEYCKYYSARNRNNMITRIAECMNKGEVIDFILEDVKLPDIYYVSPAQTQNPDEYVTEACFPIE